MNDLPAPDGPIIDPFADDGFARQNCFECKGQQYVADFRRDPEWEKKRCKLHRWSART